MIRPLLVCLFVPYMAVNAVNVLVFLHGTTQFERSSLEYLAMQLGARHHGTASFKGILIPEEPRLVKPKLHMVREMTLKDMATTELYEPLVEIGNEIPWRVDQDQIDHQLPYWRAYNHSCNLILNSNLMDKLKKEKFDVAIVYAGNPCNLAIVHALAMPFIYYDLTGFSDETAVAAGVPLSVGVPSSVSRFARPLSWTERFINGALMLKEYIAQSGCSRLASLVSERHRHMDGPISKMFREDYELKKRFPFFPDVNEIKRNAELYFVNSDVLIEHPRSLPPNVIYVGGMHIDHVKPLFSPWNTTMASAADGVIVCSMGTIANSSAMPMSMSRAFLRAFGKLPKNRIYWRTGRSIGLDGIEMKEEVPAHVNITSYLPQNDLLAAKETRLFITNGGMNGIMEALAHGIPILGIPLYGANYANLRKIEARGLGVVLDKNDVTEKSLLKAIRELLDNPKYKLAAKEISRSFKDRPVSPFETVLYWIEYVGRHHGAANVKPDADAKGNLFTLLNLDVIVVLMSLVAAWSLLVAKVVLAICARCTGRRQAGTVVGATPEKSKKNTSSTSSSTKAVDNTLSDKDQSADNAARKRSSAQTKSTK
uniref:glucuronosyltransferase n=1 Tax=Plectus sambesii TaxID=2011161 RepID=A0A914UPS5_9BILA